MPTKITNAAQLQKQLQNVFKWVKENPEATLREQNVAAQTSSKLLAAIKEEQEQRVKYGDLVPLKTVVDIREGTLEALNTILSPAEQANLQRYASSIPKDYIQDLNDRIHAVMVTLYVYKES